MNTEFVIQSYLGVKYLRLFERVLTQIAVTQIDAAVAYATESGVSALRRSVVGVVGEDGWNSIEKRWLVGIDWCRSKPKALDWLDKMDNSKVRIPDGAELVKRDGCVPSRIYHPKAFVLRGDEGTAIIVGSGNLSGNGMTRGCEIGSALVVTRSEIHMGAPQLASLRSVQEWFETEWVDATRYKIIATKYRERYSTGANLRAPTPTDDDALPEPRRRRRRGLPPLQIRQLQKARHLWIEAKALGANLGAGKPGNQLDMTPGSRVFFSFPPHRLNPNDKIGLVDLVWNGKLFQNRTLKFGDNSMDKLNVPPAGGSGPRSYRRKVLLFRWIGRREKATSENPRLEMKIGGSAERVAWRKKSETAGTAYKMTSGRQWGVF